MTLRSIPLATLLPSKGNPRRSVDPVSIAGLAESIRTDGVLQNITVGPENGGKFRVILGKRRFLALQFLKKRGDIDGTYKVPVEIKKSLSTADARRVATVENVQREALDPVDEAEAFVSLLDGGASIEDVAAKTGLAVATVKRRLALAGLSGEAKRAVRDKSITLGVAEALTLGTEDQQRAILKMAADGSAVDAVYVRRHLLGDKPSVAMAVFPIDRYTGTFTSDLFTEKDSTFFDDVEQFMILQKQAVHDLAEKHRENAAFVDVVEEYSVPWWQYRRADKKKGTGMVIHLAPSGRVEIHAKLLKVQKAPETGSTEVAKTKKVPAEYPASLLRYIALHKSMAVQAALLGNPRKAKEVSVALLLLGQSHGGPIRLNQHDCVKSFGREKEKPSAYTVIREIETRISDYLSRASGDREDRKTSSFDDGFPDPVAFYVAAGQLTDQELDEVSALLLVECFGQERLDVLDTGESLFNRVAVDLGVSMRACWVPDRAFLVGHRKEALSKIAMESGAAARLGRLRDLSKKNLVESLARHFERSAAPDAELDEHERKGRDWLPPIMRFPAETESQKP